MVTSRCTGVPVFLLVSAICSVNRRIVLVGVRNVECYAGWGKDVIYAGVGLVCGTYLDERE